MNTESIIKRMRSGIFAGGKGVQHYLAEADLIPREWKTNKPKDKRGMADLSQLRTKYKTLK